MDSSIEICMETGTFRRRKHNEMMRDICLSYSYMETRPIGDTSPKQLATISLPLFFMKPQGEGRGDGDVDTGGQDGYMGQDLMGQFIQLSILITLYFSTLPVLMQNKYKLVNGVGCVETFRVGLVVDG